MIQVLFVQRSVFCKKVCRIKVIDFLCMIPKKMTAKLLCLMNASGSISSPSILEEYTAETEV